MKRSYLVVLLTILALYFIFIANGVRGINNEVGGVYSPSDEEINYLATSNTYKGEGLYKSFSIVYPPGRFLVLAGLFNLTSPTLVFGRFYANFAPLLFFVAFFFLCYKIFERLKASPLISYSLATIATFTYFFFISSSQEAQTLSALFFLVVLSDFKNKGYKNILLGVLLGLTFLFRIDSGILLLISVFVFKTFDLQGWKNWLKGFSLIWAPVLILTFINGSLINFFYDVFYLGLIVQPKLMSLPIPPPPVGLIFQAVLIFLVAGAISLSIESNKLKNNAGLKSFALFSVLSFTAALNRSDEGHLWYGAVWLSIYISYILYHLLDWKNIFKKLSWLIIPLTPVFYLVGLLLIKFKSPFLFTALAVIAIWYLSRFNQKQALNYLVAGLIAAFLTFHSLSYLKLRLQRPVVAFDLTLPFKYFKSDSGEIAGLKFNPQTLKNLKQIEENFDPQSDNLFIYPDYVIFYEYFKLKNPTRYYYHTGETTDKIQNEIITALEKTKTNNFLIFPERVKDNRKTWQWINKNTVIYKVFELEGQKVKLRRRK